MKFLNMPMLDFRRSENLNLRRALASRNAGLLGIRNGDAKVAVIFVHGFWSSSLDTWGIAEDRFWPFELGQEIGADIYCYQFNSSLGGRASTSPLSSDQLASELGDDLLKLNQYERLFFVTHSYGGIIFKKLVSSLVRRDPLHRECAEKIFGFSAYSCPNFGHWMGTLISLGRSTVSQSARALRLNNKELIETHENFLVDTAKLPNLSGMTVGESGYLFRVFRVHEDNSRIASFPHHVSEHNHRNICRNLAPDRAEYIWVRDFLAERIAAHGLRKARLTLDPGFLGSSGKS